MNGIQAAEIASVIEYLPLLERLGASRTRTRELTAWLDGRLASDDALHGLAAGRGHESALVRRAAWRRLDAAARLRGDSNRQPPACEGAQRR